MGRARNTAAAVAAAPRRDSGAADAELKALLDTVEIDPDQEWFQPDPSVVLEAKQVARELDCDEVLATRLVMLGLSPQEITDYLNPAPQHIVAPDETVPGMTDAANELAAGVKRGEGVAIYGDYDVDGQTSLAIISDALEEHDANIHTGSANAVSGFGLTRDFVEQAHASGAKWLITVDCGSTQTEPVKLAQSLGMKVIVIDHHDVDEDNPCDHHLNPRIKAAQALREIYEVVSDKESGIQQKWEPSVPYAESLDRLTDKTRGILKEMFGEDRFNSLRADIDRYGHPSNTGSMLTWKFASAFHLANTKGKRAKTPAEHWGSPMYLAGLGAIADMAPCDNLEVRAFVRVPTDDRVQRDHFANRHVVPAGVEMLAEALEENPSRPDEMVRTKALLNLPKRTAEIDPNDIQTLLRSDDREQLGELIPELVTKYERLSSIRRDQMDPEAMRQVEEAKANGEDTYFSYAALDGFEDYAGYARMTANNTARKTGKPAIVFTRKGTDDYGQELWKFSGANDCVPEAKLGDLIPNEAMQEACTIQMKDWLGEDAAIANLGGHVEVVSGVCTTENIDKVKAAVEEWAGELDRKKKWRPVDGKRPRVAARLLPPARLRRLERESGMLAPLKFPEQPALQVSVAGRFSKLVVDDETGRADAIMKLDDGTERHTILSADAVAAIKARPRRRYEAVVALGKSGPYYIGKLAAITGRRPR